jgi:proton glutamate symport protein
MALHTRIVIAMVVGLVLGVGLNAADGAGVLSHDVVLSVAGIGEWLGRVFLTLLNMIVVPLIFSSLVASISSAGEDGMGRMGLRTLAYYLTTSLLAIGVGILMVNLIQPGVGMDYNELIGAAKAELETKSVSGPDLNTEAGAFGILADLVYRMVPKNVVAAATSNSSILSVIFFAVVFAIALVKTPGEGPRKIAEFFDTIYRIMITLTNGVLQFAPFGIAGYLTFVVATTGISLLLGLVWYMAAVFFALMIHACITIPLILYFVGGRNPWEYAKSMRTALVTAFSTASSSGTLPLTIQCARDEAGVPERVVSFTLPLGATVNMDGTALYEAVAVLFIAQMLGDLTLGEQVVVAFTALMASVGAAGIPHAGTVMMVIVLQAVGLPTDGVLVILSVDRVLDMCRTTVNVWSDAAGAAVIARLEGE